MKKLIDMDKLISAQAKFLDYKGAALNLEKLLDNLTYHGGAMNGNQIYESGYVEKLGLLYSVNFFLFLFEELDL